MWHVASPWIADDVRSDVDQLILDLGLSARDPTGRDLEAIRRHVGAAGFDPLATFPAEQKMSVPVMLTVRLLPDAVTTPDAEVIA